MIKNNKISAYLVIYNEERKIEACLKSLNEYVDEIIVVHDGECNDKTLEICKRYNCEIYIRKHIGEAEPHRPFALKKCRYNWILQIDADERLSFKLANKLKTLVKNRNVDSYVVNWIFKINGKKGFLKKHILFRKNKMYSIGLPHIQAETTGITKYIALDLLHDTQEYNSNLKLLKNYFKKNKEWGKITANMLNDTLKKIPVFNCNIYESNLKQIKKIKFMSTYPLFAIFIIPAYSFIYSFIIKKEFKQGFLGFVLALHVPLHSFFACYYLMLYKIKNDKKNL